MPSESARQIFRGDDHAVNMYRLLTALVVPRPIAWVSSLAVDGVGNLAPHSFFTVSSARPPIVQFTSIGTKDTLNNVLATGEFVINIASEPLLKQVNDSSASLAPDVDEAISVGLEMQSSEFVRPPRVAASPASIECTLNSTKNFGRSTVVFGNVVAVTIQPYVLVDGHPEMKFLQPLSRLGGNEWGLPPEVFALDRPD